MSGPTQVEGFDPERITEMLKGVDAQFLAPMVKDTADRFYCQVLESIQDYLLENLDDNLGSHVRMLERENQRMRTELWNVDLKLGRGMMTDDSRCAAIDGLNNDLTRALNKLHAQASA